MTAVITAPGLPVGKLHVDADSLSTIPDPRTPREGTSPVGSGASTPHPDLNTEVATLSNKLISAINHQTHLDDALTTTRQELDAARKRMKEVETEKADVLSRFADEQRRTNLAEQDKKRMEQELENLTSALFEEANQMVAAARKETEATEHRNEQLRMQIRDTEALLANQQEQLAQLKSVMEQMNQERDGTATSTAPSSPGLQSHPDFKAAMDSLQVPTGSQDDLSPAPPTSFAGLLSPVLRMDLASIEDFRSLAEIAKRSGPASRVNSGAYAAGNMPGVFITATQPSASSTPGTVTPQAHSGSPQISPALVALKETRFYKRALVEDIEPTLRLDTAPGLSWLVRRSVISSIVEGSLVVEPMPSSTKMFIYPCSLCGESRRDERFRRSYRFRTNENDSAQRYPLCAYCLNRLRATCDYISFLRMIKDGHWRTDSAENEKAAWEESVRLRERMFWARIGGGVIPNFNHRESPRDSTDDYKPHTPFSAPPQIHNGGFPPEFRRDLPSVDRDNDLGGIDARLASYASEQKGGDHSDTEGSTGGTSKQSGSDDHTSATSDMPKAPSQALSQQVSYDKELPAEPARSRPQSSTKSTSADSDSASTNNEQGLQITIPGGFDY